MKIEWTHIRLALHALVSAFIGAALTAVANVVITPDLSWPQLAKVAVMGGVIGTAGYLTRSPLTK